MGLFFSLLASVAVAQSCDCPAAASCAPCSGGLSQLTLQYNGGSVVSVTAFDQQGGIFSGSINPGASFSFTGSNPSDKFAGPDVKVYVDGVLNATLSSLCSSQVFVGETYGSFTLRAGQSMNGGALCCKPGYVETVAPQIANCPSSMDASLPPNACTVALTWNEPTATDNCGIASFTRTHQPGDAFPIGTTSVVYTATDNYGNKSSCVFVVSVTDNTLPVIQGCPSAIVVSPANGCDAVVNWTAPTASDNCSIASFTTTHQPGTTFSAGTTQVIYLASDTYGNVSTCSFSVTVKDNSAPVIQGCPSDITVNVTGSCEAVVDWAAPTVSDICAFTFTSSHAPKSTFPIGITQVTYTAVDAGGNKAECKFNVKVLAAAIGEFNNCPEDIVITADKFGHAQVSWREPAAPLICGNFTLHKSHAPGSSFPVGLTRVLYTAVAEDGQSKECAFNITVEEGDLNIEIGKAVTPDGDQINDFWMIDNIELYPQNKVVIMDRWGSVIFQANGYNNTSVTWTGYNQTGSPVPNGTYFYTIEISERPGRKSGSIELIR